MGEHQRAKHSVAKQLRQRKAVADALDSQKVFISSKRFKGGEEPSFRVIVSNEAYIVGRRSLDLLLKGRTPQELGLEPIYDEPND
ncbi:hypothetical protein [Mesorhizobium sp. SP-1A]|uniref:hypothetical protein n=1 Tax=Mesorhizobium sp. SP-1A TaxID=3077840 RepID=UPI0028F71A26|nr:hypothetical protein [Mesorhizobium sp. SP-1A]